MPRLATRRHHHAPNASTAEHLEVMADLFGLLADRNRLRMLFQLCEADELCVSDLATAIGLSESAVSHSLRLLRAHGLVESRRDGRWIYYTLIDEHVRVLLDATREHLARDHPSAR